MLLFVYTTTHKNVISTSRYFKLSWNTTALSQSNCGNFSCSGIRWVIDTCLAICVPVKQAWPDNFTSANYFKPWFTDLIKLTTNFTVHFLNVHHLINQHSKVLRNVIQSWCNSLLNYRQRWKWEREGSHTAEFTKRETNCITSYRKAILLSKKSMVKMNNWRRLYKS